MAHRKSVIVKKLQCMLVKRSTPDGKIDRNRLFEIVAERLGKIEDRDKARVVRELQENGVILESDKFSFTINRTI